ncbi:SNF2_N domain-containing protein, partial [Haematococcus lacustris]
VSWLRVILDEGHALGASLVETNRLQVAMRLKAERRWVMTGTPTPSGSGSGSGAAYLQPLLSFLHHDPYAT